MFRFWQSLSQALRDRPVAMATLTGSTGSVPRLPGARLFVDTAGDLTGTIGGGAAEGRCLELARTVLASGQPGRLSIDLRGHPAGDIRDGICGGTMELAVTRLEPVRDGPTIKAVRERLAAGRSVWLRTRWEGSPPLEILPASVADAPGTWTENIAPEPLALISGAGHIGRALAGRLVEVGFRVMALDDRDDWLQPASFPAATSLHTSTRTAVRELMAWQGPRFACLVTRGMAQDLDCLETLAPEWHRLNYLGVLGSQRRLNVVREEGQARGWPDWPEVTHAPIGMEIGAQSPEEIAISIAAEMIRTRHAIT